MDKFDLGLLSFTFSEIPGYPIPEKKKYNFNMDMLSKSYNTRARRSGEK